MKMPEGWKRLRGNDDKLNCPCPVCFSLELIREMAEALKYIRDHSEPNEEEICDRILKKLKEWK